MTLRLRLQGPPRGSSHYGRAPFRHARPLFPATRRRPTRLTSAAPPSSSS